MKTLTPRALVPVPRSPYVVLEGDSALGKWALESGSIIGETAIRDLPEVQALTPDCVVLDIGAFVDTPVIFALKGCTVHAFEAYPDTFEALKQNCAGFPNVILHNVAVGDGRPVDVLGEQCEENDNFGTRMVTPGGKTPTFRIDDMNLSRCDLVKIDCEGFELPCLLGMRETIMRCQPKMLVEVYDGPLRMQGFTRQEIFDFLDRVQYDWHVAIGRVEDERFDLMATPR